LKTCIIFHRKEGCAGRLKKLAPKKKKVNGGKKEGMLLSGGGPDKHSLSRHDPHGKTKSSLFFSFKRGFGEPHTAGTFLASGERGGEAPFRVNEKKLPSGQGGKSTKIGKGERGGKRGGGKKSPLLKKPRILEGGGTTSVHSPVRKTIPKKKKKKRKAKRPKKHADGKKRHDYKGALEGEGGKRSSRFVSGNQNVWLQGGSDVGS